ncbi:MAG: S8 family peptidase [Nanobdellota archaeon]
MTIAKKTKKGVVMLSDRPLHKQKNRLVSEKINNRKAKKLEDLLGELSSRKSTSYVADEGDLYQVTGDVKKVASSNESIAEFLVDNYSPMKDQYIGMMRKGKPLIIDDYRFTNMLAKATKPGIPKGSKKKLVKKLDQMIDSYFSMNFIFKNSDQKRISKQAQSIPEESLASRSVAPFTNILKKKDASRLKNKVVKELDRLYFRNKRQDLLVNIGSNNSGLKNDIAAVLMKDLGATEYFVFESIPYIAVPCSLKDIDRVCYALNNRKTNYLRNMQTYAPKVRGVQRSSGVYTPELFSLIANDLGSNLFRQPNMQIKDQHWNLRNIHANSAWRITQGNGSSVLVVDTGVDYNHMDLKHCFGDEKGYNFVSPGKLPMDDNRHGTHVAGTVAGRNTGVAPGCRLYSAKVLDDDGSGSTTDIIRAIDYGVKKKDVDIVTMSLGSPNYSHALEHVCKSAYRNGLIVCAAAGNEGYGAEYPASCSGVISVAAVDSNNEHANFSNIYEAVDISAPGVSIYSTLPGNHYGSFSGTSMATPHCAGLAALATSVKNSIHPGEFEKLMKNTSLELGAGESQQKEKYGAGLMQADGIVEKLYKLVFRGAVRWKKMF